MSNEKEGTHLHEPGHELLLEHEDSTIQFLHRIIRTAVKILAVLMVLVIVWGIGDVIYVLYQRVMEPPFLLLSINDIFATFGAFLAVLIAIEIFVNISMYLSTNVIPVRLRWALPIGSLPSEPELFDCCRVTVGEMPCPTQKS